MMASLSRLRLSLPLAVRGFMSSASHLTNTSDAIIFPRIDEGKLQNLKAQFLAGSWMAARSGHVRSVYVEVKDDNFELALNKYGRLMRQDKTLNELMKRQSHLKPSELKVLARKERDRRIAKKEFKEKLKWIMSRRSRGF